MGQARGRKTGAARLTHLDARGQARMVDVGAKPITERVAVASATMRMQPATLRRIQRGGIAKGEVLAVARIAGIMAAKRTADIIPSATAASRGRRHRVCPRPRRPPAHHRHGPSLGQDRRRDGSAHRRERRRVDRLRHVQGDRPRHGHHRPRHRREIGRPLGDVDAEGDESVTGDPRNPWFRFV